MAFLRRRRKILDEGHGLDTPGKTDLPSRGRLKSHSLRGLRLHLRFSPASPRSSPLASKRFESDVQSSSSEKPKIHNGIDIVYPHQVVFREGGCPAEGDSTSDISGEDQQSEESLLGAWSMEEEEVSKSDKELCGMERVRHRLDQRDRLMCRLTARKSEGYRKMIASRQVQARYRALESQAPVGSDVGECHGNDLTKPSRTSLVDQVTNHCLFEGHHSLEASWNVVWYSAGHLAMYMGLDATVKLFLAFWGVSESIGYVGVLLTGITIMRLNGYLWQWLGPDSYRLVKFDLHNRRLLGLWDASLMNVMHRDHEVINDFISITAYYLIFISLTHFYYKILAFYELLVCSGYTTLEARWVTRLQKIGYESCGAWLEIACKPDNKCTSLLGYAWEVLLSQTMNRLCVLFSDLDLKAVSIVFHSLFCLMSWGALRLFELRLFET